MRVQEDDHHLVSSTTERSPTFAATILVEGLISLQRVTISAQGAFFTLTSPKRNLDKLLNLSKSSFKVSRTVPSASTSNFLDVELF